MVKTYGSIYKDFLSCKTSNPGENGVGKAHVGPTSHQGAPGGVARPGASWAPGGSPQLFLIFVFFSNIPKLIESIFMEFLESVYLPYHIPTPFQGSGAFWKDSLVCFSVVIV